MCVVLFSVAHAFALLAISLQVRHDRRPIRICDIFWLVLDLLARSHHFAPAKVRGAISICSLGCVAELHPLLLVVLLDHLRECGAAVDEGESFSRGVNWAVAAALLTKTKSSKLDLLKKDS